jgi:catechol 2,3-dioxygenase-like lactoylglutathione lyase family enzyme
VLAKLDHCVIHVSDWERSNAFYRDALGADLIDRGGGTWAYRFGTEQLNVHLPGARPDPVALIPVAPGNSDLCFEWRGPIQSAVTQHRRQHDVRVEQGPVPRNGATGLGMSVYFRDPTEASSSSSPTSRKPNGYRTRLGRAGAAPRSLRSKRQSALRQAE